MDIKKIVKWADENLTVVKVPNADAKNKDKR